MIKVQEKAFEQFLKVIKNFLTNSKGTDFLGDSIFQIKPELERSALKSKNDIALRSDFQLCRLLLDEFEMGSSIVKMLMKYVVFEKNDRSM